MEEKCSIKILKRLKSKLAQTNMAGYFSIEIIAGFVLFNCLFIRFCMFLLLCDFFIAELKRQCKPYYYYKEYFLEILFQRKRVEFFSCTGDPKVI